MKSVEGFADERAAQEHFERHTRPRRALMQTNPRDFPMAPDDPRFRSPFPRPAQPYTEEQVDHFFAGRLQNLDAFGQGSLFAINRLRNELARLENDPPDEDDKARVKAHARKVAYFQREIDREKLTIRAYILGGGRWGEYDRTCELARLFNASIQDDTEPTGYARVEQSDFDALMRRNDLIRFERYAAAVVAEDLAGQAWGWGEGKNRLDLAVAQLRAGLPIDV